MNPTSRSGSSLLARTSAGILMLSFGAFVIWTAGDLLGRPLAQTPRRVEDEEDAPKAKAKTGNKKPRVEEEEEAPRKKQKRKVIRVEEEEDPKAKTTPSRPAGPVASDDLARLAEQATQPAVKALFRSLAVPYDLVLFKPTNATVSGQRKQREEKIEPTPFYLGTDPDRILSKDRLHFTPFSLDWKSDKKFSFAPLPGALQFVRPYEQIAWDKVQLFLRDRTPENSDAGAPLSRYDKLVAAEQVLSAVLRWHESARLTGRRENNDDWKNIEKDLRDHLLNDVLLGQMNELTRATDWNRVLELARRLAVTYKGTEERKKIFEPVAHMIQNALRDNPTATDKPRQQALERLHELEREFPDSMAFKSLDDQLSKVAQSYKEAAQQAIKEKKMDVARNYLIQAQKLYPQLPGLGKLVNELSIEHPTLCVGVRGKLPLYFTPSLASSENERRAIDLLYESLVKLVPDEAGGYRYERGLSESYPKVAPLTRQFELPRHAVWSDGKSLAGADVDFSLGMLKAGRGVDRSRAWGNLLLKAEWYKDPYQITVRMEQGFRDPLALMTFKILPGHRGRELNDPKYGQHPVTSGPFYIEGDERTDEHSHSCRVFLANPYYRLRPSKHGAPHIQEIRLCKYQNAFEELSSGKLQMVLDLTAEEASKLIDEQNAGRLAITVPLPSSTVPNRRIYFLAVNTSRLADANLRQALSCAIDREKLLNKHFRGELKERVHKALTGPFPVGSWPCKPDRNAPDGGAGTSLFNPEQAKVLSAQQAVQDAAKTESWKLLYPDDDNPALKAAIAELCEQVKARTGIALQPTPLAPDRLRETVEGSMDYALAYYSYDFPDETYWLGPLFGPPPGADPHNGTNIFKFQNVTLTRLLEETRSYRDFAKLCERQCTLFRLLNSEMPFIPLWQLDPLLAYHQNVHPVALDPQMVFRNIEEWHVVPK